MAEEKKSEIIAKPKKPNNAIQCDNYINGEFIPPSAQYYFDVTSPHDNSVIGKVAISNKKDVEIAVKAAVNAYEKWSKWTVKERVKPLLKLRQILEEKENELVELIMLEHGKNRTEALG
eukprot:835998_1